MTDDPFKKIQALKGVDTSKLLSSVNTNTTTPSNQKSHDEFPKKYKHSIDGFIEHRKKKLKKI